MNTETCNTTAVFLDQELIHCKSIVSAHYSVFDEESRLNSGKILVEIFDLETKETENFYTEALNYDSKDKTLRLWSKLDLYYEWLDDL